MRQRVAKREQHKARGVSLPPHLEKAAMDRAFRADISFSKYVQRLIAIDMERNLVPPLKGQS